MWLEYKNVTTIYSIKLKSNKSVKPSWNQQMQTPHNLNDAGPVKSTQ